MYQGKKVIGIVAEFNPFHEGHRYLIRKIRERHGDCIVLAVMSGDFVERGEPAIFSKYERTEQALRGGVDMVLEIPVMFATASAENFASAGISLLRRTGLVDQLVFGSESGNLLRLDQIAEILVHESEYPEFRKTLSEELHKGRSYPAAREQAVRTALRSRLTLEIEKSGHILEPNDVLGIEYLKALKRQGNPFPADVIVRNTGFASAHAIRKSIHEGQGEHHERYASLNQLSDMLSFMLLKLYHDGYDLADYLDVSEDLANAVLRHVGENLTFTERIQAAKTRNYTYSRVSRALLHILLDIRKTEAVRAAGYFGKEPVPVRVLGVRAEYRELLGQLAAKPITSMAKYQSEDYEQASSVSRLLFEHDLFAADLYRLIYPMDENEYTRRFLVLT
jgi:predicted nucleotidyltransferase